MANVRFSARIESGPATVCRGGDSVTPSSLTRWPVAKSRRFVIRAARCAPRRAVDERPAAHAAADDFSSVHAGHLNAPHGTVEEHRPLEARERRNLARHEPIPEVGRNPSDEPRHRAGEAVNLCLDQVPRRRPGVAAERDAILTLSMLSALPTRARDSGPPGRRRGAARAT
jgi:hypothetical protein